MRLFLCDPVERQFRALALQGQEAPSRRVQRIEVRDSGPATRRAVEAAIASDGDGASVLLVHAQGVGRACPATESWFGELPGYDLAVLYSEAWDDSSPPAVEIAPQRWRVGTTALLAHVRPFLDMLETVDGFEGLTADMLLSGSWEPVLRERVLDLLGLLLPAAVAQEWDPGIDRLGRCFDAVEDLVHALRSAVDAGRHPGWGVAGGVLEELATMGSADDQAEALTCAVGQCLPGGSRTLEQRQQSLLDLRDALLRLIEFR